ncbi:MAG: hypothetical protein VX729_14940 [Pseudomonadota bacterium]|nr:hypothetical protein [Pseudomonadota bacterium]
MKKLTLEDVISILKDPFKALVVEPMGASVYIANQGNDWSVIEQVSLNDGIHTWLTECEEQKVIFYASFEPTDDPFNIVLPHFFDIWRDVYETEQPNSGKTRAAEIGLIE